MYICVCVCHYGLARSASVMAIPPGYIPNRIIVGKKQAACSHCTYTKINRSITRYARRHNHFKKDMQYAQVVVPFVYMRPVMNRIKH